MSKRVYNSSLQAMNNSVTLVQLCNQHNSAAEDLSLSMGRLLLCPVILFGSSWMFTASLNLPESCTWHP